MELNNNNSVDMFPCTENTHKNSCRRIPLNGENRKNRYRRIDYDEKMQKYIQDINMNGLSHVECVVLISASSEAGKC